MEFLQQFEAVPLVELPIAVETKGETTAEGWWNIIVVNLCAHCFIVLYSDSDQRYWIQ